MLCKFCTTGRIIWEPKFIDPSHPSHFFEGVNIGTSISGNTIDAVLPTCAHFGYAVSKHIHRYHYLEKQKKMISKGTISNKEYNYPISMIKKGSYLLILYASSPQSQSAQLDIYFDDQLTAESIGGQLHFPQSHPVEINETLDIHLRTENEDECRLCIRTVDNQLNFYSISSGSEFLLNKNSEIENPSMIVARGDTFIILTKHSKSVIFDFNNAHFEIMEEITPLPLSQPSEIITSVCLSPSEEFMFVSYYS